MTPEQLDADVLKALEGRSLTTTQLAAELGITRVLALSVVSRLRMAWRIEKIGIVNRAGHKPTVWGLPVAREVKPTAAYRHETFHRNPIVPPSPMYTGEFSHMLGEPPVGRSALDRRNAQ
jgi:hypothetical protein